MISSYFLNPKEVHQLAKTFRHIFHPNTLKQAEISLHLLRTLPDYSLLLADLIATSPLQRYMLMALLQLKKLGDLSCAVAWHLSSVYYTCREKSASLILEICLKQGNIGQLSWFFRVNLCSLGLVGVTRLLELLIRALSCPQKSRLVVDLHWKKMLNCLEELLAFTGESGELDCLIVICFLTFIHRCLQIQSIPSNYFHTYLPLLQMRIPIQQQAPFKLIKGKLDDHFDTHLEDGEIREFFSGVLSASNGQYELYYMALLEIFKSYTHHNYLPIISQIHYQMRVYNLSQQIRHHEDIGSHDDFNSTLQQALCLYVTELSEDNIRLPFEEAVCLAGELGLSHNCIDLIFQQCCDEYQSFVDCIFFLRFINRCKESIPVSRIIQIATSISKIALTFTTIAHLCYLTLTSIWKELTMTPVEQLSIFVTQLLQDINQNGWGSNPQAYICPLNLLLFLEATASYLTETDSNPTLATKSIEAYRAVLCFIEDMNETSETTDFELFYVLSDLALHLWRHSSISLQDLQLPTLGRFIDKNQLYCKETAQIYAFCLMSKEGAEAHLQSFRKIQDKMFNLQVEFHHFCFTNPSASPEAKRQYLQKKAAEIGRESLDSQDKQQLDMVLTDLQGT